MNYYPPMQPRHSASHQKIITVSGQSYIMIPPNIAKISLGVSTDSMNLENAQQENNQKMNTIISLLLKLGINKQDIKTSEYTIMPLYHYENNKKTFQGYRINHILTITNHNIDQTGKIIDLAVANGANLVTSIDFTVDDPSPYYQKALSLAVSDALKKAETIAHSLNLTLDPHPIHITEETTPYQTYATITKETAISATSPVEPGQLKVTAKIKAGFPYLS